MALSGLLDEDPTCNNWFIKKKPWFCFVITLLNKIVHIKIHNKLLLQPKIIHNIRRLNLCHKESTKWAKADKKPLKGYWEKYLKRQNGLIRRQFRQMGSNKGVTSQALLNLIDMFYRRRNSGSHSNDPPAVSLNQATGSVRLRPRHHKILKTSVGFSQAQRRGVVDINDTHEYLHIWKTHKTKMDKKKSNK